MRRGIVVSCCSRGTRRGPAQTGTQITISQPAEATTMDPGR